MGTIFLPFRVGPKTLHILFHIIEGDLQYNILLGRPLIDEMKCVPSNLYQFIKFIHEGKLTCVKSYLESFQCCNFIPSYDDLLSSIRIMPIIP